MSGAHVSQPPRKKNSSNIRERERGFCVLVDENHVFSLPVVSFVEIFSDSFKI